MASLQKQKSTIPETNISHPQAVVKMNFLFPFGWDSFPGGVPVQKHWEGLRTSELTEVGMPTTPLVEHLLVLFLAPWCGLSELKAESCLRLVFFYPQDTILSERTNISHLGKIGKSSTQNSFFFKGCVSLQEGTMRNVLETWKHLIESADG